MLTSANTLDINSSEMLQAQIESLQSGPYGWVKENTAILVVHGIGNQLPMETLDQFGRGFITAYKTRSRNPDDYLIEHVVYEKEEDMGTKRWLENVVRIRYLPAGKNAPYIDLHEYYWANQTEGRADWNDISDWIRGITSGARKYYKRNMELAEKYGDQSALTYNKGNYRDFRYFLFIGIISHLVVGAQLSTRGLRKVLNYIPLLGPLIDSLFESMSHNASKTITNILGDLVAYSVTDAKSKYYPVRSTILNGAVDNIKTLLEAGAQEWRQNERGEWKKVLVKRQYPAVLVAAHSLGSVVSFDALNRINLIVNACQLPSYDAAGNCLLVKGLKLSNQLRGFITFGSPLDKVAFFMRENLPDDQWLRQQLINDFVGFKRRDLSPWLSHLKGYFPVVNEVSRVRLLDEIPWRNYHDRADYVSGGLDYYSKVTNVNCGFKTKTWFAFTHSNYWNCQPFFDDIIRHFLVPEKEKKAPIATQVDETKEP